MSLLENSLEIVLKNNNIDSSKLISKLIKVKKEDLIRTVWRPSKDLDLETLNNNTKIVLKICDTLIKNEAFLAGGSVLSAFSDFRINDLDIYVNKKNSMNIYKDLVNIGYKDIPALQTIAPAYDQSFFRKNHILSRTRLKNDDFMPIDLMIIPDNIPLVSVVTNFDLSFCEIWFDGQNVYAVDPEGIKNKEGILKPDYLESLFKFFNQFIQNRIKKYISRGFKISYSSSNCSFLYKHSEIKTINNPNGTVIIPPGDDSNNYIYPEEWVVKLVLNKFYTLNCQIDFNIYYHFSLKEFTWQELFSMLKRYYHITPLSYGLFSYIGSTLESIPMPPEYRWINPENPRYPEDASPEFKQKRVDMKVKLLIKYLILTTLGEIFEFERSNIEKSRKWSEYINNVLNSDITSDDEKIINGENFYVNFQDLRDIALSSSQTNLLTDILYMENILDPTYFRHFLQVDGERILAEEDKSLSYNKYKNILDTYFITINQRSSISYYKNNYLIPENFEILDIESYSETSMDEWLNENPTNVIFLYNSVQTDAINGIKGVGLTKNALYQLYAKLIVECKKVEKDISNITQDIVYIDKIYNVLAVGDSFNNGILLSKLNCVKDELEKEGGNRIFYLTEQRFLKSISALSNVVFYNSRWNIYGSIIDIGSSAHCGAGQQTYVYDNIYIIDKSKLVNRKKFDEIISSGLIPTENATSDIQKYQEISSKISSFIQQINKYSIKDLENAILEKDILTSTEILLYLNSTGVDLNKANDESYTPLMYASIHNLPSIVSLLINKKDTGIDINKQNLYGETALILASRNNNLDVVKLLIEAGADPLIKDTKGKKALDISLSRNYIDIIDILRPYTINYMGMEESKESDIIQESKESENDLDLYRAAENGIIELLNNHERTALALMRASQDGNLDEVNALIETGSTINAQDNYGFTPLMYASEYGRTDVVNVLIKKGANVDLQDDYGMTALMYASEYGHIEVVNSLIEAGTNVNLRNDDGYTALMYASRDRLDAVNALIDAVNALIAAGANVNLQNKEGDTALMKASRSGSIEIVNALIAAGVDVDLKDKYGMTALMCASQYGHTDVVNALIKKGADVNLQNNIGYTSLMYASQGGHIEVVNVLIAAGANINLQNKYGMTALMHASEEGHIEVVNALMAAGANINLQNEIGYTSLMYASQGGHIEVVNVLIAAGANVDLQDEYEMTALMHASEKGHIEVVNALMAAGANVDLQDGYEMTALMYASEGGHIDIVNILNNTMSPAPVVPVVNIDVQNENGDTALIRASQDGNLDEVNALMDASLYGHIDIVNSLIEAGANINLQDDYGMTALMHASEEGRIDIVNALIEARANVNLRSDDGYTALMYASEGGHIEVVNVLMAAGANVNLRNYDGYTAFDIASDTDNIDIVNILNNNISPAPAVPVINIDVQNTEGDTALILASRFNDIDEVNRLIAAGANVNLQNIRGNTALIIASMHGYKDVVNYLIEASADINLQNNEGETALMHAASNNDLTIVNALIVAGANPNLRDNNYESNALDFAIRAEIENGDNTYTDVIIALQRYVNELYINNSEEPSDSGERSYYDGMFITERMSPRRY